MCFRAVWNFFAKNIRRVDFPLALNTNSVCILERGVTSGRLGQMGALCFCYQPTSVHLQTSANSAYGPAK